MQKKWLAKGTSAVALVALIATATAIPAQAHAGGVGPFATEYTQLSELCRLVGQLEKQVMMVENQLTQIADMAKHGITITNQLFGTVAERHHQSQQDREHGPIALLYDEHWTVHSGSDSPATHLDKLRAVVFQMETNKSG